MAELAYDHNCYIKTSYSYEDYKHWEGRWELIGGEPIMMASPNKRHQEICLNLSIALKKALKNCEDCEIFIAPMDYIIDEYNVVQPDVLVVCNDENSNFITETPKIIFEVLSFSTAKRDRTKKYQMYEKAGVAYYAIINPNFETIEIYRLKRGLFQNDGTVDNSYRFDFDKCRLEIVYDEVF